MNRIGNVVVLAFSFVKLRTTIGAGALSPVISGCFSKTYIVIRALPITANYGSKYLNTGGIRRNGLAAVIFSVKSSSLQVTDGAVGALQIVSAIESVRWFEVASTATSFRTFTFVIVVIVCMLYVRVRVWKAGTIMNEYE